MAKIIVPPAAPEAPEYFPYVDDERDTRDSLVVGALNAAIQLIEDEKAEDDDGDHIRLDQAAAVIRLARDRLDMDDVIFTARFTAEVAHD